MCEESVRKWRRLDNVSKLVDLKFAYLHIHVDVRVVVEARQLVKFKGRTFSLTRLGFGLSCALRIMSRILNGELHV